MSPNESVIAVDPLPRRIGLGKRNLDLFLHGSKKYPICFYFEDEGSEELYLRFLRRIFPKQSNHLVVCTGGKTKKDILDDASNHQMTPIVFLQDKDFDDLIGELSKDVRVVTLNRYSFENYLFDPDAFIEIVVESKRRVRRDDLIGDLCLDDYFASLYGSAIPLTKLYVISRKFNLRNIKTTKQSIYEIVGRNSCVIDKVDLDRFKETVVHAALKSQRIASSEEIDALMVSAIKPKPDYKNHSDAHPNSHLCGKQMLELALMYVDQKTGLKLSSLDRYEIVMRLLQYISISVFDRVRDSILASLQNQGVDQKFLNDYS